MKNIHNYTMIPVPIYDLISKNDRALFVSHIHPKGINTDDILREKNHIKRKKSYIFNKMFHLLN